MKTSTRGIRLIGASLYVRDAVELISSMRFAITLLSVISVASIIGTVIKQGEPYNNYVNQFGPFWADVFERLNLYTVYSAWWFLLILAFLVVSTSLCISRNAPRIVADWRAFKENLREQSLQAFSLRSQANLAGAVSTQAERMASALRQRGYRVKAQARATTAGEGVMLAARAGRSNKLGYLAAHSSIVLIALGGLADGDLIVRAQMAWQNKTPFTGGGLIAEVPEQHRLGPSNPTFRANLLVPEGSTAGTAILGQPEGVVLQDLPFGVELKKFVVEYYPTGMPRLFASDIVIHDPQRGTQTPARVEVNHPVTYDGIQIFQSSFDDGGSKLQLAAVPLLSDRGGFEIDGTVGGSTPLRRGEQTLSAEWTGLRVINVENVAAAQTTAATDVRAVNLGQTLKRHLGAGNKAPEGQDLRNVGPSFSYKLRDGAGQAIEFNNYMLPVSMEGQRVYLLGVRETTAESFRYLRVPVDGNDSMDDWLRLRRALADPAQRARAVRDYVRQASAGDDSTAVRAALATSAARALDLFAGDDPLLRQAPPAGQRIDGVAMVPGGLSGVSYFLDQQVPPSERERAGDVLMRMLNGSLFALLQNARAADGLTPLVDDQRTRDFMAQSVLALSDAFFYPSPLIFTLNNFDHIQASVFQVARAPGRTIVYIGCALLILGVFLMIYVRERRLWVWLKPSGQGVEARMAMAPHRAGLASNAEFAKLHQLLQQDSV
ncbi:MAG: cytochrome c biogenesis protein ResB [Burkholderiaceae bacterium]